MVEEKNEKLQIYRYKKPGKRGIMPMEKENYYNKIDIEIFMLFLDLCLQHEKIDFNKEIIMDGNEDDTKKSLNAIYTIMGEK